MARNLKGLRVAPRQYPSRKQEPKSYNHKQLNSANSRELGRGPWAPGKITAPAVTLISTQWDLKQGMKLGHDQMFDL